MILKARNIIKEFVAWAKDGLLRKKLLAVLSR